jgi:hypothetical protein
VEEALGILESNEREWLEAAVKYGIPVPAVKEETLSGFSGKFTVRVSAKVHKDASICAREQGISLNQYVNDALIAYSTQQNDRNNLEPLISEIRDMKVMLLNVSTETRIDANQEYEINAQSPFRLIMA